jgi:hypothetical protein
LHLKLEAKNCLQTPLNILLYDITDVKVEYSVNNNV